MDFSINYALIQGFEASAALREELFRLDSDLCDLLFYPQSADEDTEQNIPIYFVYF